MHELLCSELIDMTSSIESEYENGAAELTSAQAVEQREAERMNATCRSSSPSPHEYAETDES